MLEAIEMSPDQERQLTRLMRVFLEENKKINLSAYREEEACWIGNILDSVAGADLIAGSSIIDIGIGGGFPLLPLALLFPELEFAGIDATRKKIDAVQRVIDAMGINNVRLHLGRCEELGHDLMLREQFDIVLSRAVAPLSTLLEFMSPFARAQGRLLCWKSMSIKEELTQSVHAAKELNCTLIGNHRYTLPGDWGERQILIYEKEAELSEKYPREIGIPKKEPL